MPQGKVRVAAYSRKYPKKKKAKAKPATAKPAAKKKTKKNTMERGEREFRALVEQRRREGLNTMDAPIGR